MQKLPTLVLIISCVILSSCTRNDTKTSEAPSSTPTSSAQVSTTPEASGGFAPPEVGDTSAEDFAGTIEVVEKKPAGFNSAILKEVRTGRHEKFDRVVFEFMGPQIPGYRVEYLSQRANTCGAGDLVEVAGQGDLLVALSPAHAHNQQGQPTVTERDRVINLAMLKQMKLICDFEADVQWVLGVAKANPFRVVELTNPARLVVDVKH